MKKRRVCSFLVATCYSLSLGVSSGITVEALEGFGVSSEETVKVSASVLSVMAPVVVGDNEEVTLDLGGATLSDSSGSVVRVGKGATLTLSNGTITGGIGTSSAGNHKGGGIYVETGGTVILKDVTVTGNNATHGGGVYLESGATLTLTGSSTIKNNKANNEGGGVNASGGTVNMSDSSTITNNTSSWNSGGVHMASGTLNMEDSSSISSNNATNFGGGVYLYSGTMKMDGSAKVNSNTASVSGGGIQILSDGKVYLKDSVQVIGNKGNGETQNMTARFEYIHLQVEALGSAASIGLSIVENGTYYTGKIGNGYGGHNISEEEKKLFFSDSSDYGVLLENNVLSIGEIKVPTYIVSFKDQFHSTIEKEVNEGSAVSEEKPTESGYEFLGWFVDERGSKAFNFSTKITEDVTLHALWVEEEVEEPEVEIPPSTSTTTPSTTPTVTPTTPTIPEVEEEEEKEETTTTPPTTSTTTPTITPTITPSTTPNTTPTVPEVEEEEQEEEENTETNTPSTSTPTPEVEEPEIEEEVEEEVEEPKEDEAEPEEEEPEEDVEEPEEEEESEEKPETTETPSTGGAIPGIFDPEKPFYDVQPWDWFYEQVYEVFSQGLMAGTSETEFSPYINTTRGMVATILYQFDGKLQTNQEVPYPDVNEGDYFAVPVAWALEHGVFAGYDDGLFRPHQQITREDLALVLYRYTQKQGGETGVKSGALLSFYDVATVSAYAWEGLSWAVSQGVMEGRTGNVIGAKDPATRSEMATMLTHLLRIVK